MKSWILVFLVFCCVSSPFSLGAVQNGLRFPAPNSSLDDAQQELDFSWILGHEVFVDYAYRFLFQVLDELALWSEQVSALASNHPDASISRDWENQACATRAFLEQREDDVRLIAFIGMGIYPHKEFFDEKNSIEFKQLQHRLFSFYIDYLASDDGDIEEMEKDLVQQLRDFCMRSEDVFFSERVLDCLGDASNRVEVLFNALSRFDGNEEKNAELSKAFAVLEKNLYKRLQVLVAETFSRQKLMELVQKILDI